MSCYFRHIKDSLDEAGIEVTPSNRKQIDQVMHQMAEVTYKDCPVTWKRLKQQIIGNEQKRWGFAQKLRESIR